MPRKLYRYQPIPVSGDDRLSLLKSDEMWFSDPAGFNDPFDLKPKIMNLVPERWCGAPEFKTAMRKAMACLLVDATMYQGALFIDPTLTSEFQCWTSEGEEYESEVDWEGRVRRAIERRVGQFGVACLTPLCDSRLMWAHYASNGRGFCIEYEVDGFMDNHDVRYVPVQYASEIPALCISEAMFTPHQFLPRVMATKHADWAYEQEIRLVCLTGKAKKVKLNNDFVRLTGLIAGYAMPESLQAHLKETAARLGVRARGVSTHFHGRLHMDGW